MAVTMAFDEPVNIVADLLAATEREFINSNGGEGVITIEVGKPAFITPVTRVGGCSRI
jgi:hypothetical protein